MLLSSHKFLGAAAVSSFLLQGNCGADAMRCDGISTAKREEVLVVK
jgi:hypothetical protein